ncbi:MAG TPA: exodeoxyribonuclease VII small subunit [Bacteroidia bacterium]|jgi:exodeoxyribonuclease VII small subunit|nr:exodeoxyribonuclease VII small subunit [Bacteroidia bacterium]
MKDISYTDALNELNEISHAIEDESISIDELSKKVKRAAELITLCKTKLRVTEEEVKKIIGEMGE